MTDDQFERLAQMIKGVHDEMTERFDAVDARFNKVDETLEYLRAEVRDLRSIFESLKEKVDSQSGYAKEIDHAFTRLSAIEKHLGMPVAV